MNNILARFTSISPGMFRGAVPFCSAVAPHRRGSFLFCSALDAFRFHSFRTMRWLRSKRITAPKLICPNQILAQRSLLMVLLGRLLLLVLDTPLNIASSFSMEVSGGGVGQAAFHSWQWGQCRGELVRRVSGISRKREARHASGGDESNATVAAEGGGNPGGGFKEINCGSCQGPGSRQIF